VAGAVRASEAAHFRLKIGNTKPQMDMSGGGGHSLGVGRGRGRGFRGGGAVCRAGESEVDGFGPARRPSGWVRFAKSATETRSGTTAVASRRASRTTRSVWRSFNCLILRNKVRSQRLW